MTVAIFVPCFNARPFLEDCLSSVLRQTYADWTLKVIDNQSNDGSYEIAQRFSELDPRISVERNESNLGMVGNWNRCLERIDPGSSFVKILCADDVLPKTSLEDQVNRISLSVEAVVCCGPTLLMNRVGASLFVRGSSFDADSVFSRVQVQDKCLEKGGNAIGEPSVVLFRSASVKEHRLRFDPRYSYAPDLAFWLRLLEFGGLVSCEDVVAGYRIHESALTPLLKSRDRMEVPDILKEAISGRVAQSILMLKILVRGWLRSVVIRFANSPKFGFFLKMREHRS